MITVSVRSGAAAVLSLMVCTLAPARLWAQVATSADTITEVIRLRDAGQFTGAIALLQRHLAEHPLDSHAAGLLAETLYWTGDVAAARRTYEEAQQRNPDNTTLRVQHARMLVQLNEATAARRLLALVRETDETAAEAEALLGTLAHWEGDLTSAQKHFQTAVRLRPGQAAAVRGLAQIAEATAPWVRTATHSFEDDQPLSRKAMAASAGVYLSPLHSLQIEGEAERFTGDDPLLSTAVSGRLRSYWPRLRLETELGGGLRWGTTLQQREWMGRGGIGVRLSRQLIASMTVEHEPYLRTLASLSQRVTIESARARVDLDTSSGWLGQVSYSRIWYPDRNVGHLAHGWILAPVIKRKSIQVRGGYVYVWEDTRESRFKPDLVPLPPSHVVDPVPPGRGRGRSGNAPRTVQVPSERTLGGYYGPYYTPIGVRAHSVTASAVLQPNSRMTVQLNGAHGVHAREQAPFFSYSPDIPFGSPAVRAGLYPRRYRPLNARGAFTALLAHRLQLEIELEHTQAAYWRGTQLRAGLLYRFRPLPVR